MSTKLQEKLPVTVSVDSTTPVPASAPSSEAVRVSAIVRAAAAEISLFSICKSHLVGFASRTPDGSGQIKGRKDIKPP